MKTFRTWAMVIAAAATLYALGRLFLMPDSAAFHHIAGDHSFPPSFDGHRWLYATALAGLLAITSLALNVLIEDLRFMSSIRGRWREPAKLSSVVESLFLLTIVMGFAPDAIVLLAWGDPSAPSAAHVVEIDRFFDFLCVVPFLTGWILRARIQPVAQFQLMRQPIRTDLALTWPLLRPKLVMLLMVVGLSVGVAFAK